MHELASIEASHINGKILIIPPWVIPRLHLEFDLLWNAASFQEMEKGVVLNYLRLLSKSTWNIFLVSLIEGLPKGFHGQKEPISLAWLIDSITKMDYTYSRCEKDCVEKNVFDLIAYDKKTLIYDVGYFRRKDQ